MLFRSKISILKRKAVKAFRSIVPALLIGSAERNIVDLNPYLPASQNVSAYTTELCYAETNQCVEEPFSTFFPDSGGVPVFGFPTSAGRMISGPNGEVLAQNFERNRLEHHPTNPDPYKIQLGRLGADRLQQLGRDWQSEAKGNPADRFYSSATGHGISFEPFAAYYDTHGLNLNQPGITDAESTSLFGLALTEPAMETNASGDTVLTQWFERARFEYHPNNPPGSQVLLGLLGNEVNGGPETSGNGVFPAVIGDLSTEGIALFNMDERLGFADNSTDENNWTDLVEVRQQFAPNERFAFYIYGPEDVEKLPPDPPRDAEGKLGYDPVINYPGGRGVGRQVRRLHNGIWEYHFTLPEIAPGEEAYVKEANRAAALNILTFIPKKNQAIGGITPEFNEQIKELIAIPYTSGKLNYPVLLIVRN